MSLVARKLRRASGGSYIPPGEFIFEGQLNSGATTNFVVPAGVTSICAVCIGSGASGELVGRTGGVENGDADGGGGGNLRWKNDIPVTPGETLELLAGGGGDSPARTANATTGDMTSAASDPGRSSYISRSGSVLLAAGGAAGANTSGKTTPDSTVGVDGVNGGNGSNGANGNTSVTGNGGDAGQYLQNSTTHNATGARLYGLNAVTGAVVATGNQYGAGGAGDASAPAAGSSDSAGNGSNGAIRIIWGTGRSFPYNAA